MTTSKSPLTGLKSEDQTRLDSFSLSHRCDWRHGVACPTLGLHIQGQGSFFRTFLERYPPPGILSAFFQIFCLFQDYLFLFQVKQLSQFQRWVSLALIPRVSHQGLPFYLFSDQVEQIYRVHFRTFLDEISIPGIFSAFSRFFLPFLPF